MSRPQLHWLRAARRERTIVAERRIWRETSGRYRVVSSRAVFGPERVTWYALRLMRFNGRAVWSILSRHRQRGPAFSACRRDAARPKPLTLF